MTFAQAFHQSILFLARAVLAFSVLIGLGVVSEARRLNPDLWWAPPLFWAALTFVAVVLVLAALIERRHPR